jgi:hypothetical protein
MSASAVNDVVNDVIFHRRQRIWQLTLFAFRHLTLRFRNITSGAKYPLHHEAMAMELILAPEGTTRLAIPLWQARLC